MLENMKHQTCFDGRKFNWKIILRPVEALFQTLSWQKTRLNNFAANWSSCLNASSLARQAHKVARKSDVLGCKDSLWSIEVQQKYSCKAISKCNRSKPWNISNRFAFREINLTETKQKNNYAFAWQKTFPFSERYDAISALNETLVYLEWNNIFITTKIALLL